ncbi:MAG: nucleotidyltransferase domain-containing protein [Vicinamibacterales bacterium]
MRGSHAERFGVRSLSTLGSTVRDEARPDSDVDVLVEFVGPVTFDAHLGLELRKPPHLSEVGKACGLASGLQLRVGSQCM